MHTLYPHERAAKIVNTLNSDAEDECWYELDVAPDGKGLVGIKVFDEDGEFLGHL